MPARARRDHVVDRVAAGARPRRAASSRAPPAATGSSHGPGCLAATGGAETGPARLSPGRWIGPGVGLWMTRDERPASEGEKRQITTGACRSPWPPLIEDQRPDRGGCQDQDDII